MSNPISRNHRNESEYRYTAVTLAGREVSIAVTAATGTEEGVVRKDVLLSMAKVTDLRKAAPHGVASALGVLIFLWFCVFGIGMVVAFLCTMADFGYREWIWSSYVPILGSYGFWMGLFRVWVLGFIPIILIAIVAGKVMQGNGNVTEL